MLLSKEQYKELSQGEWVGTIYNYWEWAVRDILSLCIRILTCGPNHAVSIEDGYVYEMVGSSLWWVIKKKLGYKVSYEPNEGSGYKKTPLAEWMLLHNRKVRIHRPLVKFKKVLIKEGYGFLDLIQIALHIIRTVWFMIGNGWNGTDGTGFWQGLVCSEFIALKLGRADAKRATPADLERVQKEPDLAYEFEFETEKA